MNKLVSVVIPCFNQGAYIQEAVNSVKAQTFRDVEIIIVNDGSDDTETLSVLDSLAKQGYQVINIQNSGVSAARNIGIAKASGEYILPLDADDKIDTEYIKEAVKILNAKPEVKVVYCNGRYFGNVNGPHILPDFSLPGMLNENLIFNAALFRKKDFDSTEGYDTAFLTGWEDWEFWLRFIKDEKEVYKLPGTYFFYRRKEISRNEVLVTERLHICERQLFEKHIDLFLKKYPAPLTVFKERDFYKNEYGKIEEYRAELLQSASYKLGHLLLSPFKFLKKNLKK